MTGGWKRSEPEGATRRAALGLIGMGGASLLAACSQFDAVSGGPVRQASASPGIGPEAPVTPGAFTVALIVPLSAPGGAGAVAAAIKNSADMAMAEFVNGAFQLSVKDDLGTPDGAKAAATAAVSEGARVILGPLFGPSVAAAAAVARPAGVPMIAFSSDASVAQPGVYLLSFMPQSDVDRVTAYAVQNGHKSFAALVPQSAYGSVAFGELQQAATRNGARVVVQQQFGSDAASIQGAVAPVAAACRSGQVDAVFLPADSGAAPAVARALVAAGVDNRKVQFLGTGVWDDNHVFAEPALQGGVYAAPDSSGFQNFAGRYRARYGADPVRLASVGYDAVSLIAALLKAYGPQAFTGPNITNPAGFNGIDGAFRFRTDGTNERSLAVLRVTPKGGQTVSPAARAFSA